VIYFGPASSAVNYFVNQTPFGFTPPVLSSYNDSNNNNDNNNNENENNMATMVENKLTTKWFGVGWPNFSTRT
jgi:hypothetical protein